MAPAGVIRLMAINVRGLTDGHRSQLGELLRGGSVDVIGVLETHLHAGDEPDAVDGFTWHAAASRFHPMDRARGGVGVWLRSHGGVAQAGCEPVARGWRVLWFRIPGRRCAQTFVAMCYAPTQASESTRVSLVADRFWASLSKQAAKFASRGDIIIMGDLNGRVGAVVGDVGVDEQGQPKENLNSNGRRLLAFVTAFDLVILNGQFANGVNTYVQSSDPTSNRSIVDYVLVQRSAAHRVRRMVVDESLTVADHLAVRLDWATDGDDVPRAKPRPRRRWLLPRDEAGWARFREAVEALAAASRVGAERAAAARLQQPAGPVDAAADRALVKRLWAGVLHCLSDAADGSFRRVPRGPAPKRHAGGDAKSRADVREREQLHDAFHDAKAAARTPAEHAAADAMGAAWRRSRCRVALMLKLRRFAAERKRAAGLEELRGPDTSGFYRALRPLIRRREDAPPVRMCRADGRPTTSEEESREAWTDHFRAAGAERPDAGTRFDAAFFAEVTERVRAHAAAAPPTPPKPATPTGPGPPVESPLDRDITAAEVDAAIASGRLANRKASDPQSLVNELITRAGPHTRAAITALFRVVWATRQVPDDWLTAHVVPIYKGAAAGPTTAPGSYRPIALTSVVAKLYETVLAARLTAFTEAAGVIGDEQGGFRPGRGCVDHAFILSEIIASRREDPDPAKRRTFLCFLDLSKAYDSVWRDGLWSRLLDCGIDGRMWHALRALYRTVNTRVAVAGGLGDAFTSQLGVRQGCVLSPILFSLFISGVIADWVAAGLGVTVRNTTGGAGGGERKVAGLLFADDIVLIADSEAELHRALEVMDAHARRWRYSFNTSKCAVVVTTEKQSPTGCHERVWNLQGGRVPEGKHYRYLGVILQSSGRWTKMLHARTAAGRRALPMLWRVGARLGRLSVATSELLVAMLVRSRMAYGSELTDPGLIAAAEAEAVQLTAARQLLGLPRDTRAAMALGELGWQPIAAHRAIARLRFLSRLQRAPPGLLRDVFQARMASAAARFAQQPINSAVRAARAAAAAAAVGVDADLARAEAAGRRPRSAKQLTPHVHGWCALMRATLEAHGLLAHFDPVARDPPTAWAGRCALAVAQRSELSWHAELQSASRTGRSPFYRWLKPAFGREPYLDVGSAEGRRFKAQLRTLTAPIAGRRSIRHCGPNAPALSAVCPRCSSGDHEWPAHVLLDCTAHAHRRLPLVAAVDAHWRAGAAARAPWWLVRRAAALPDWWSMAAGERCHWLLADVDAGVCKAVATFLAGCSSHIRWSNALLDPIAALYAARDAAAT